MPTTPEWSPASLVTAAAGAAAHSRRLTEARKDGSEEDLAKKTSLPPPFGASRLDSPRLPNAPLDAPDDARSPATTATALKAAARAAAAAASRGTFLKGEPPAPSPGERLGDEVARVAGSFLGFATSMLDRVDALHGRAEAAEEAERARAREIWMLSSPQRARGVRETKAEVLEALDACGAALEEAEAAEASETRTKSGDERAPPETHDSPSDKEEHTHDPLCDSSSDASSPRFSDLELSDEEEETRVAAASFAEALAKESRKKGDVARDARSVAAAAAAIADAATRGIDVCERAVAELEHALVYGDARKSEENADVARGNENDSSTSAAFDEEEEAADAAVAAAAADAVPGVIRMTPRETFPGPSKDAVLSAYIPKRLDRRHKRKTTPPKLKKQEKAEKQKADTAVSRDGVALASRAEHPRTRSADLFADFVFAGTQKK